MINFKNNKEELTQVMHAFYERINHPYVRKFIGLPTLDEDKVWVLTSMIKENNINKDHVNQYILIALLVQAALDTHETISTNKLTCNESKKKRQLTVLAGDYYSSLYYFLLSELKDIQMINTLAKSIQEVNESKMNIYISNNSSVTNSIEDIKIIESSVLQKVADYLNLPSWKKIISEFFFLKRLANEKNEILGGMNSQSYLQPVINNNNPNKYIHLCDQYIEQSKQKLYKLCSNQMGVKDTLMMRVDEILGENSILKEKVVEEG